MYNNTSGRMNRKRKGTYYERKARKILESQDYYVIRSAGSLGLFDLVAIHKSTGEVRLIQVKSGKSSFKGLVNPFKTDKIKLELWVFNNKQLKIISLN